MANLVLMPQLGISEESAILAQWLVKEGDTVNIGDGLFSLETGKSAFTSESEYAGVVLKLLVTEGDEIPIQTPVCVIGQPGEAVPTEQKNTPVTPPVSAMPDGRAGISPRARGLAERMGVDAALATPTGPENRVIERDIHTLAATQPETPAAALSPARTEEPAAISGGYTDKKLTTIRKIIAANMVQSLASAAQLTHTASFDATSIQTYRAMLKQNPDTAGITLTDMVLYAVSRTLPSFPALNAWFMEDDTLRCFDGVHLACAVDTERGLMVPVIRDASDKTLAQLSQELKTLAAQCRDGSIDPELLSGGSFTVSNLGAYGIESFTPIINPPQTGILGVNTIVRRVKLADDGSITTYPSMALSLTYDHRALDGAPASQFLQALCRNLERFPALLAGG